MKKKGFLKHRVLVKPILVSLHFSELEVTYYLYKIFYTKFLEFFIYTMPLVHTSP